MFAGPFDAGAARRLAGFDGDDQRFDALVDELVHASLVVADTSGPSTRYRLLESVRRFALDRLEARGGRDAAFDRFADQALQRAREILRGSTTAWRPELVREMVRAYDDLAEALRWCNRHDTDPQRAWRLCASMWAVVHQGRADDVVIVGRQTIERWPFDGSSLAGAAVATLATAEYVSGEPDRAIALAESTSSSLAAPSLAAVTLRRVLGQARRAVGDVPGALAAFRDGADIARQLDMPAMAIELDVAHAQASADDGRVEEALPSAPRQRRRVGPHRVGRQRGVGPLVPGLGPSAGRSRRRRWRRSSGALEMSRRIDYPIGVAVNLRSRAFAELLLDDVDAARATVAELLDDVLERGAISHARLVVDVAAVLAHRIGDASWAQLASTAAALPTATLVGAGYDLVPLPAGGARPLGRREAIAMVVRLLAAAPPVADAAPPAPGARRRRGVAITRRAWAGVGGELPRSRRDGPRLQGDGRSRRAAGLAGPRAPLPRSHRRGCAGGLDRRGDRRRRPARLRDPHPRPAGGASTTPSWPTTSPAPSAPRPSSTHWWTTSRRPSAVAAARGGRPGPPSAPARRSRNGLRGTMRQLADAHPELGRHLRASVTTGLYCSYTPPDDTTWHVERAASSR